MLIDTCPKELKEQTFSVHHNPNCPSPFEVRLLGPKFAVLDNFPRGGKYEKTKDICGYGKTLEAAARDALKKQKQATKKLAET